MNLNETEMGSQLKEIWIVATIFAPAAQVLHWMEVNALNCGVKSFRLYLESHEEKEGLERRCELEHPDWRVALVAANEGHYSVLTESERAHIASRQCYNLRHASEYVGQDDWVLHIDVDEVIVPYETELEGTDLREWVRSSGLLELDELRFEIAEYAAEQIPAFNPGEFPAHGMFKIRPYRMRAIQYLVRLLFPRTHPLIGPWHFRGHVHSKAAFRVDNPLRLGVHGLVVHRGAEEERIGHERHKTRHWMLLHFDSMHVEQIERKFEFIRRDLLHGGPRTSQRVEVVHRFLNCKTKAERNAIFRRFFSITPPVRRLFVSLGLMQRIAVRLPASSSEPEMTPD